MEDQIKLGLIEVIMGCAIVIACLTSNISGWQEFAILAIGGLLVGMGIKYVEDSI